MGNKDYKWKEVSVNPAGEIDGALLPIECLCGYGGHWEFPIPNDKNDPEVCPKCGRKYYFKNVITVFVSE